MCWIDKIKNWKVTPDCLTSGGQKMDSCSDYFIAQVSVGVRELMTGEELTLQNDLPVYIQKASDLGIRRIILQKNGVRLANE